MALTDPRLVGLVQQWRDKASGQGAIYAQGLWECADALEAALLEIDHESRSPDGDGHEADEANQPEGTLSAGRVDPSTNTHRGNTDVESRHPGNRRSAAVKRTPIDGEIDGPIAGSEPADSQPLTLEMPGARSSPSRGSSEGALASATGTTPPSAQETRNEP